MRIKIILSTTIPVLAFLLAVLFYIGDVQASVSSCTASISPSSVNTNKSTDFSLTLNNTSSEDILWIRVTRPSDNFTLNSVGLSGWPGSADGISGILTGGTLPSSNSAVILVTATSGSSEASTANWLVEVADDQDGNDITICTGSLGTAISGIGSTDTTGPAISNLVVSDVTQTSVKVTWTTDENSNSVIEYGTSEDYGSTKSDSSLGTSHSLTLDSLSANTTYHFNVKSTDSSGNISEAGDNTFVSSKAATTSTTTVTNTTTTITTVTKLIEDIEKPTVIFSTKFDKAFSASPKISGKVTDNAGTALIEYSIDGGANYLPVDETTSLRSKLVTYSFNLYSLLDGNYKIKVRATDLTGNVGTSEEKTLVFDRLPPSVGGSIFTLGSVVLTPEDDGNFITIAGAKQKVTLSAVGGPTEIQVNAKCQILNSKCDNNFMLQKNSDTGLWSGTISFDNPGNYLLRTKAIDGAGNETESDLASFNVLPKGQIVTNSVNGQRSTANSNIHIYYFEPTTNEFTLWDGESYGETNPISTDEGGNYSLILPSGKYFLQISNNQFPTGKAGQAPLISNTQIFTLTKTTPINTDFVLNNSKRFKLGSISFSLPEIFQPQLKIATDIQRNRDIELQSYKVTYKNYLVGKEIPSFELKKEGDIYDNFYFRGKPTIIAFLNSWMPSVLQQLSVLDDISKMQNINTIAVFPQESESKINIFRKLGNFQVNVFSDPDGIMYSKLEINKVPSYILADTHGTIQKVGYSILDSKEILNELF